MSDDSAEVPAQRARGTRSPNKFNADVKWRILKALDMVGGEHYLAEQAKKNPAAFMSLLGKVLPLQVKAEVSDFRYVVQKLIVTDARDVPGVISTGLPSNVRPIRLPEPEQVEQADTGTDGLTP